MNEVLNNYKKSEVLADEISKLQYGTILTHQQITSIIDEEYPSNKYRSEISKAKKILLKRGIVLESISGDGYRIVEPDNFVNHSLKHYKRGFNEMQKGYDILDNAPTENMSQEGLSTFRRMYDRAISLASSMKGVSVELKTLSEKKKHPMSIENIQTH